MEERCWPIGAVRLSLACVRCRAMWSVQHRCNDKGTGASAVALIVLTYSSRSVRSLSRIYCPFDLWLSLVCLSLLFAHSAFVLFFPSIETEYLLRFVPPTRHPLRNMTFKPPGRWSVIVRWKAICVNDTRVKIFSSNLKVWLADR